MKDKTEEILNVRFDQPVEPWEYNPSAYWQRVKIALIALPATVIAFYMGLYQLDLIPDVWDPVFGDQTKAVLNSDVSHTLSGWFRIPDAILGGIAYLGDIIFALVGTERRWQYRPWIVVLFGLDVIPLGIVSAILVVLQGIAVGSWCFLCLVTAVISLILVVMAYDEVWSCMKFIYRCYKQHGYKMALNTFIGRPSKEAEEIAKNMLRPDKKEESSGGYYIPGQEGV